MYSLEYRRHVRGNLRKKWRLMHATDFQSLMYPCFSFCRIFAIFPYRINDSTFEISKPHYIFSTVIICVCCIVYLLIIHGIIISKTITYGEVIKNFEAVCYFTFSYIIAIITYILSGSRMRLLQTILEISSKLSSKSYRKLSRFIHFKDILGTMFLIMQGYMYFTKVQIFEINCLSILTIVFGMYMALLVLQMNMLYINCVCVLKACFKNINDNLARMQKLMINDIKPGVPNLICHMQRNQFLLKELKTLEKQHLMISETVQMLNIIFSPQLLATVTMYFIEMTFQLYSYVVRWQNGLLIGINWDLFDVFLASMAQFIVKMTLIVWACETGKNQAHEIVTTIHDVLNSTRNEQIKDEVKKVIL